MNGEEGNRKAAQGQNIKAIEELKERERNAQVLYDEEVVRLDENFTVQKHRVGIEVAALRTNILDWEEKLVKHQKKN